ncbi:uncharacterized protein [Centroberyx affinis]|uniref:uncharacterized protein isoform X2 n=1 Tax=Centroberyx affinis TaxID=166261 RepID=UPI003A5C39EC
MCVEQHIRVGPHRHGCGHRVHSLRQIGERNKVFKSYDVYSINVSCEPLKKSLFNISFQPSCHIKLNPPVKPAVNFTTVSWPPIVPMNSKLQRTLYSCQLQWKQEAQSWEDASDRIKNCHSVCEMELYPDSLEQGERYEVRARVRVSNDCLLSTWSDWGPTASWVSLIGTTKPPPTAGPDVLELDALVGTILGAVLVLFLAVMFLRTKKSTWVYVIKKIRGPPLPDPAKSSLHDTDFQTWLKPQFTSESLQSFLKPVDVVPVEVTNALDGIAPWRPDAALLLDRIWDNSGQSTNSSYSNPRYFQLCPRPLSSLTGGNLEPCAADSPYGPVAGQKEEANGEKGSEEEQGRDTEILQSFKSSESSEAMQVCPDHERVEKLEAQRCGLRSPDSGMGSGEEEQVSQESLEEADSISMTGGEGEGLQGGREEEREEEKGKDADFHKLFGGIFSKGSIPVCSGYERVEQPRAERPELQSPDSGTGSGGEEQVSQESLEDYDTSEITPKAFLFPPPSSAVRCFLPSLTPLPLNFCGPGMSSALRPLPAHILEGIPLTPSAGPIEPSGDGYMPARESHS